MKSYLKIVPRVAVKHTDKSDPFLERDIPADEEEFIIRVGDSMDILTVNKKILKENPAFVLGQVAQTVAGQTTKHTLEHVKNSFGNLMDIVFRG